MSGGFESWRTRGAVNKNGRSAILLMNNELFFNSSKVYHIASDRAVKLHQVIGEIMASRGKVVERRSTHTPWNDD